MKRYLLALFAMVALFACNDDLSVTGFAGDPNAVRFTATVGDMPLRSNPAGDEHTVTQFNPGDKIAISTEDQETINYTYDGTTWSPDEGYLVWNKTQHTFTAYYPSTYSGTGDVPADQSSEAQLAAADYMTYHGTLRQEKAVTFTLARQTARIIIDGQYTWNAGYLVGGTPTHRVTNLTIHSQEVSHITPYQQGDHYALVNPGTGDTDSPFITLTVEPIDGDGDPITHTVTGIPAFQAGWSYRYHITIGADGATISTVTVDDWTTGSILNGEGSADDEMNYYLYVVTPEENFSFVGGSKTYKVRSIVEMKNGEIIPLPWTAKFVRQLEDRSYEEIKPGDTDYPTWIAGFTNEGIGEVCIVTVETAETDNNHFYTLKNNAPVSGIYNLSNATGGEAVENTANCYIVNAPGSYSFPLVYGNAVKNGADNQSAYISTAMGNNALENFVNHNNAPITSPYIAAHEGCIPADAILVWQDAENLVGNIQFVDGGSPEAHRITFDVAEESIKQGNAIIAVRNAEGTILWSWHIWVTDYKPLLAPTVMSSYNPAETQRDKVIKSYDGNHSYTFMGVPLGWCDAESAAGHEVIIQYTQPETGRTYEVTVKQDPLGVGSNLPYYQWGRKDPMLPSNGLGNDYNDKSYSGNYRIVKGVTGKVTIGTAIQNPHIIYDGGEWGYDDWYSAKETVEGKNYFQNMWDVNNISPDHKFTATTKTIYDPSPVGYVVPPSRAFSGLTSDGNNTDNWNKVNTNCLATDDLKSMGGMTFYCNAMNSNNRADGGVIYFPTTGFRAYALEHILRSVGTAGMFWSACSYGSGAGRIMEFSIERKTFVVANATPAAQCAPVRPVRE